MTVNFKFGIGDILYTYQIDKEGDLVLQKGKVEYCYLTIEGKNYACTYWGAEINENEAYTEKELMKLIPTLLKTLKE